MLALWLVRRQATIEDVAYIGNDSTSFHCDPDRRQSQKRGSQAVVLFVPLDDANALSSDTPAVYAELRTLFDKAVQLPRDQRSTFLEAHPAFAAHLEALLGEDESEDTPLDCDPAETAADLISPTKAGGMRTLQSRSGSGSRAVLLA